LHNFGLSQKYLATRSNRNLLENLTPLARHVAHGPLTPEELEQAKTAWSYFETFTNHRTGFAQITADDQTVTPWEMGANLLALVCAGRLALIAPDAATARINQCIETLTDMPLAAGRIPNAFYHVETFAMLNRKAELAPRGVGWSPARIMRLIAGLIVVAHHHTALAPVVALVLKRWHMRDIVGDGRFLASQPTADGQFKTVQQGVLGYEQYAARCGVLIDLPLQAAMDMRPILRGQWVNGQLLPGDKRLINGRAAVITPEPFCLEALEFGWRPDMRDVALTLFMAQKARFEETGTLTALTEDTLDTPPGFAFHGILAGHQPFASFSTKGRDISHLRCLSIKAAFCWWALLRNPYSQKLVDCVSDLASGKGWLVGRYEETGKANTSLSLNTNAVILEALHYKAFGPLFPTD